jgi:phage-related minor tail protein
LDAKHSLHSIANVLSYWHLAKASAGIAIGAGIARVIRLEAEYAALAAAAAGGAAVVHNDGAETGSRTRPKRQKMTAMEYFAGLDVGMEATAICVMCD